MSPPFLHHSEKVKLAWLGDVVPETSAIQLCCRKFSKRRQRHVRSIKLAVESASGVEVPANHDLWTCRVPYATSMQRRFAVGRDGKSAFPPLAQFGKRVWWMPCQASNRRPDPLDSRFEQGIHWGPRDRSNTVLVGTASGVVKARTIKRSPPSERWTGSLLDEAHGIEQAPISLEDDGGKVGIRAPVLHPHAAFAFPHRCLNFDKCDEAQSRI